MANITELSQFQYVYVYVLTILKISMMYCDNGKLHHCPRDTVELPAT